ncbi:fungal-specific transcription factor domain-containing protein [Xylariomycetidae sp. FL2044]|nr:fungal-specific transcription factor domain-containing protein [Xylariomycetidae sp. FL2044]
MTASSTRTEAPGYRTNSQLFINTTSCDVYSYRRLRLQKDIWHPAPQPGRTLFSQPQPKLEHAELVYYFRDLAYLSLVTFHSRPWKIRDLLMSLALTYDQLPGRALLYALLAFSSLHRSGLNEETLKFKVGALQALSASAAAATQGPREAALHVATCMLLCAFDLIAPSESSGEWLWYIRGAMRIAMEARLGEVCVANGIMDLLDWVHYHDTLSRFAVYHWRRKPGGVLGAVDAVKHEPAARSPKPTHAMICDTLIDPRDPESQEEDYKRRLSALESRINQLPSSSSSSSSAPAGGLAAPTPSLLAAPVEVEMYQASTLVYLLRATQSPWEPSPRRLERVVEGAFAGPMIRACASCPNVFPLFILALEARTDERRLAVLALMARSGTRYHHSDAAAPRSMAAVRRQVRAFWVQQDLHADAERVPDYLALMRAVVSSNGGLPSYA